MRRIAFGPRLLLLVAAAAICGVLVAWAAHPLISEVVGQWEVSRAYSSLEIPNGWTRQSAPTVRVLDDGGVLLTAVYKVDDAPDSAVRNFIVMAQSREWKVMGSSPDLSSVRLERDGVSLGVAILGSDARVVRLDIVRNG
jgi:hypothetical protein